MTIDNIISTSDFSDRRVVFVHDPETLRMCAEGSSLYFSQSANGPTKLFVSPSASDTAVKRMAERLGVLFDELRAFCDQTEFLRMEATIVAA